MASSKSSCLWKTFSFGEVMSKIILLSDIIEQKLRKEQELEFYQAELEKLQNKMFFLRKEIDLTNTIIDIIDKETVYDVKENMIERHDE